MNFAQGPKQTNGQAQSIGTDGDLHGAQQARQQRKAATGRLNPKQLQAFKHSQSNRKRLTR